MRILSLLVALGLASSAAAQTGTVADAWIRQLQRDGYEEITVQRTWLGRYRIVAERDEYVREIIVNRATGEVLRDYSRSEEGGLRLPHWFDEDDDDDPKDADDDDKDDDDEEDDADEDDDEDDVDDNDDDDDEDEEDEDEDEDEVDEEDEDDEDDE